MIHHYFHVYAAGIWREPVTEHLTAIGQAAFCGIDVLTVTLIGREASRQEARDMIREAQSGWCCPPGSVRWIEADEGWEQVTLQAIRADALATADEYAVLYAHTKGAHDDTDLNRSWRRAMTARVVGDWQRCAGLLADHDAVGCHWVVTYPENPPFFAGNFWWARASYLRTLPEPQGGSRYWAELWLPRGNPVVADLLPGLPNYS